MIYYILDKDGDPVLEPDLQRWAAWMAKHVRILRQETVGGYLVSTVFLGVDHNYSSNGPPVLWETLVGHYIDMRWSDGTLRKGLQDEEMYRHTSREEAMACHLDCVARYAAMAKAAKQQLDKTLANARV